MPTQCAPLAQRPIRSLPILQGIPVVSDGLPSSNGKHFQRFCCRRNLVGAPNPPALIARLTTDEQILRLRIHTDLRGVSPILDGAVDQLTGPAVRQIVIFQCWRGTEFQSRFPAVPRPLRYFILIEIIKVDTEYSRKKPSFRRKHLSNGNLQRSLNAQLGTIFSHSRQSRYPRAVTPVTWSHSSRFSAIRRIHQNQSLS